jgi:hypothetical protein
MTENEISECKYNYEERAACVVSHRPSVTTVAYTLAATTLSQNSSDTLEVAVSIGVAAYGLILLLVIFVSSRLC